MAEKRPGIIEICIRDSPSIAHSQHTISGVPNFELNEKAALWLEKRGKTV